MQMAIEDEGEVEVEVEVVIEMERISRRRKDRAWTEPRGGKERPNWTGRFLLLLLLLLLLPYFVRLSCHFRKIPNTELPHLESYSFVHTFDPVIQ